MALYRKILLIPDLDDLWIQTTKIQVERDKCPEEVHRNNLWDRIQKEKNLSFILQCSSRLLGSESIWEKVKVGFGFEKMEENDIPNEGNKVSQDTKVGNM